MVCIQGCWIQNHLLLLASLYPATLNKCTCVHVTSHIFLPIATTGNPLRLLLFLKAYTKEYPVLTLQLTLHIHKYSLQGRYIATTTTTHCRVRTTCFTKYVPIVIVVWWACDVIQISISYLLAQQMQVVLFVFGMGTACMHTQTIAVGSAIKQSALVHRGLNVGQLARLSNPCPVSIDL